jgi:hypothetical protein
MVDHSKDEGEWKVALKNMQLDVAAYDDAKKAGNEDEKKKEGWKIVQGMRRLADIHPDANVRKHWEEKAKAFEKGDDKAKSHILEDIGKGLLILLATPFALAGAALFGAGAIIYGLGTFVKGLGTLLTGGIFR